MTWVLVFVYLYGGVSYAETYDEYPTMVKCFQAREVLGEAQSGRRGYFPNGQQALCIPYDITADGVTPYELDE